MTSSWQIMTSLPTWSNPEAGFQIYSLRKLNLRVYTYEITYHQIISSITLTSFRQLGRLYLLAPSSQGKPPNNPPRLGLYE